MTPSRDLFSSLCHNTALLSGSVAIGLYIAKDLSQHPQILTPERAALATAVTLAALPPITYNIIIPTAGKIAKGIQETYTWCKEHPKEAFMTTTAIITASGYYLYPEKYQQAFEQAKHFIADKSSQFNTLANSLISNISETLTQDAPTTSDAFEPVHSPISDELSTPSAPILDVLPTPCAPISDALQTPSEPIPDALQTPSEPASASMPDATPTSSASATLSSSSSANEGLLVNIWDWLKQLFN